MTDTMEARKMLEEEMRLRKLYWTGASSGNSLDNRIIAAALAAMSRFAASQRDAVIEECARDGFNVRDLVLSEAALEISSHVEAYEGHPSGKMFGDGWRQACEEMAEAVIAMRRVRALSQSPHPSITIDDAMVQRAKFAFFKAVADIDPEMQLPLLLLRISLWKVALTAALTPEGK